MSVELAAAMAIKLVASMCGAVLALIFQPPKTKAEFWTRTAFSIVSGFIFGGQTREYLKWPVTMDTDIAATCLTALLSWWIMGALVRLIEAWKGPGEKKG